MSDHEMLELAAKAVGMKENERYYGIWHGHDGTPWDPLKHDGDALRLAVDLGLNLYLCDAGYILVDAVDTIKEEFNIGNAYAATRRAIVRAAAEIAKFKEANP